MHQAHDVEVTQPWQQSASNDTRRAGQQDGAPCGARRPARDARPGKLSGFIDNRHGVSRVCKGSGMFVAD